MKGWHERKRNVRGKWLEHPVRDTTLEREMEAECTPDVSCVVTITVNCLLHPMIAKKEQIVPTTKHFVCAAGTAKEHRNRLTDDSEAQVGYGMLAWLKVASSGGVLS